MSDEKKDDKNKLEFLYKAIDDTQNTIRFTDTKAGVVIAFWTLVMNILIRTKNEWYNFLFGLENKSEQFQIAIFIIALIFFFLKSVWLSYLTLVPRINPNNQINTKDFDAQGLFFLAETTPEIKGKYLYGNYKKLQIRESAKDYHDKISMLDNISIEKELVLELQKISLIRNVKIARASSAITAVIYFLITIMLLFTYLFGSKIFGFIEINNFVPGVNFNIKLFIILYIGHKIADYLLQTDRQAVKKTTSWKALLSHSFIYTLVLTAMGYIFAGYFSWIAIFIIFVSHVIIDRRIILIWWAKNVKKMTNTENESVQPTMMELDQAFHYIIIFLVSCLK
ncbi:DUF3307 domain-containing protein [Caldifermentibacillus hisashii]|uniref:DUF3307 domain-containing protein n=1 Tax=Caldifermentibacillus hisashii TaxID=996558 RepID=UPI0022B9C745|nr:DUF3307 domain-containing protein [Caldifermentibacillus hisashii]